MVRTRSVIAGVLVAGVVASGAAFAQGPRGGNWFGGGRGFGDVTVLRGVTLTEAQQQQIRDIRERHRQAVQQAGERVTRAAEAQRKAVESVPLNEGLIRSTSVALAEAQTEAAIQRATVFNEIWSLLTPEQQAQITTLRAEREARRGQRGQRGDRPSGR